MVPNASCVRVAPRIALLALLAGATAALAAGAPAPRGPSLDLATARLVDLTHAYGSDTLFWPASPAETFQLRSLHRGPTPGGWFYSANAFCSPEHGGTHMDAPVHFGEHAWSVEQVPVDRLVAPAVVIDVTKQAANDRDYRLTTA